jgi:hypothetical protein
MAQSFDVDRLVLSGEPVRVAEAVTGGQGPGFSASPAGGLAYVPADWRVLCSVV